MRTRALAIIIPLTCFYYDAFSSSQDTLFTLSGSVTTVENTGIDNANVLVYNSDSILVSTTITDRAGLFSFDIRQGHYYLSISAKGKQSYQSALLTIDKPTSLPAIQLANTITELLGAGISAKKPLIERRGEAIVLNITNSITASGNSAYELVGRCPGVYMDGNDNISMRGKTGVIMMMDGKRLPPMDANSLANYLKSIPATAIEEIRIITNPSARYDASGSAGIIDIRFKKDNRMGTNGTVSLSALHGRYPKTNDGISLNHRNKAVNIFGSYNYSYRKGYNQLDLTRRFYKSENLSGAYVQHNYLLFPVTSQLGRIGMDYSLNKNTIIGVSFNASNTRFNPKGENVSDVLDSTASKASSFETSNRSHDHWWNYAANVNLKHTIDSSGKELNIDLDHMQFGNTTTQLFTTRYFDLSHAEYQPAYILYGDIRGNLNIYAAKADYIDPDLNHYRFESGVKSSYVRADNNLAFYNQSNSSNIFDSTKSNHFIYNEHINAGYVTMSRDYKKWFLQGGVRYEQTNVRGEQLVTGQTITFNYYQLFPSASITYKATDNHEFGVSVTRRIDRPTYDQLNPFKFFLDPTTYKEGNPYLRPQLTWSYDVSHTYKQKITSSLTYSKTIRNITEVIVPDDKQQRVSIQTNRNITSFQLYGSTVSAFYNLMKNKWNGNLTINGYYGLYKGNMASTVLNNGRVTMNLNCNNTYVLSKKWTAEVNANYRAPELYGYMHVKSTWFINAGIQARILKNKGTLKVALNDIFFAQKSRATSLFYQYYEYFRVQRDTRVASLTFNYRFGNSNVAAARKRQSAAEEEKRRAQKGMG